MDGNATITRRQFIVTAATAAGGLAIGLATGPSAFGATAGAQPWLASPSPRRPDPKLGYGRKD